jgi:uncharacterized protein
MKNLLYPLKHKADRYKVWYTQAQFDLQAAQLSIDHGYFEWATFQSEQAVEKAIKAVIVKSGWRPPKMHKLSVLIGLANQANPKFERTKFEFRDLESFTFISRYPFLIPGKDLAPHEMIKKAEADRAYNQANDIISKIAEVLSVNVEVQKEKIEQHLTQEEVEERINEVVGILVREFDPEKIVLFGSFANDTIREATGFSTMDILVITNSDLPFLDRIIKARVATKGGIPAIEPIVYTPEEFKTMVEEEGEGLLEEAIERGRVIYEKPKTIANGISSEN